MSILATLRFEVVDAVVEVTCDGLEGVCMCVCTHARGVWGWVVEKLKVYMCLMD